MRTVEGHEDDAEDEEARMCFTSSSFFAFPVTNVTGVSSSSVVVMLAARERRLEGLLLLLLLLTKRAAAVGLALAIGTPTVL